MPPPTRNNQHKKETKEAQKLTKTPQIHFCNNDEPIYNVRIVLFAADNLTYLAQGDCGKASVIHYVARQKPKTTQIFIENSQVLIP